MRNREMNLGETEKKAYRVNSLQENFLEFVCMAFVEFARIAFVFFCSL